MGYSTGTQTGMVRTRYVRPLLRYLEKTGVDCAQLYTTEVLALVQNAEQRLPIELWLQLYHQAIAHTGDADLALKVAECTQLNDLGMLGAAAMSSDSLRYCVEMLVRYERLVDEVNSTQLVEAGSNLELHWLADKGPASPIFMQHSLAAWCTMGRLLTGQAEEPVEAHFSFAEPAELENYQRIFGATLYFSQPITKLVLDKALLEVPIIFSNPEAHRVLIAKAETDLKDTSGSPLVRQVRIHIKDGLAAGRVSLEDVATRLQIPARTLQHQLKQHGVAYRDLVDELRQQLAKEYLKDASLSLGEIAFLLGFAEQSPFQNAFRRWTGQSPGKYRKDLLAP